MFQKIKTIFQKELLPEQYRKDFPFFQRTINNKPIIYFDNACMSLRPKQVIDKSNDYYYNFPGCAGRSNHQIAEEVETAVNQARTKIAKFFGADSKSVVFTKNTTEAINLVSNAFPFKIGDVVLGTDKEHNSNLIPWLKLQKRGIIKHDFVESDENNQFSIENFENKLKQYSGKVKLVSMVYTSNLDGTTNPVKEIIKLAHKNGAKVLLDCAQAALHHEINFKKLEADYIAVSGHKLLGPSGIGVLISDKENLELLDQFLVGGETVTDSTYEKYIPEKIPERFEAGLQNYAGIIGFGEAVEYLEKIGRERIHQHLIKLNQRATEGLLQIPKVKILGPKEADQRSGIVSFVVDGKKIHEVALLLSKTYNIMIRSGAHCVHSWFNKESNNQSVFKDGTVRASFSFYNTEKEVDEFVKAVREISQL